MSKVACFSDIASNFKIKKSGLYSFENSHSESTTQSISYHFKIKSPPIFSLNVDKIGAVLSTRVLQQPYTHDGSLN